MLRSISLPVKTAVRRYILDHINPDGYGIEGFSTPEEAVLWCYETFKREKAYEIRRFGERKMFESWLFGLASALDLPFLYSVSAKEVVQAWRQQTDDEADLYDEGESECHAMRLVAREFFAMVRAAQDGRKVIQG